MRRPLTIALMVLGTSYGQEPAAVPSGGQDAVDWAIGLGSRFRELHNPVVAAHALGQLGSMLCPHHKVAASGLFRDALSRLTMIPQERFLEAGPVLPASSFTGLANFLIAEASKCDPDLAAALDQAPISARIAEERSQSNYILDRGARYVSRLPDRAAQLADAALTTADPRSFNVPALGRFLSILRDRAPDLSDELFGKSLRLALFSKNSGPAFLGEIGKYLFVDRSLLMRPDRDYEQRVFRAGESWITDFGAIRRSTNMDDVPRFIDAVVQVNAGHGGLEFDFVIAYALAYQMLAKSLDYWTESSESLEKAMAAVLPGAGSYAAEVRASLNPSPSDPLAAAALRNDRLLRRILAAGRGSRFDEARGLLPQLDDADLRRKAGPLIDFAEAAHALGKQDSGRALDFAGRLPAGIKRSLLYTGIAHAADEGAAVEILKSAVRDAESLPAEHRAAMFSAIASVAMRASMEQGMLQLGEVVASMNNASANPRRWRFEPRTSGGFSVPSVPRGDAASILLSVSGFTEIVDSGAGRHGFPLKVPGVQGFQLPAVLRQIHVLEKQRLEAVLLGLRDETQQAGALNALAARRLAGAN